MRTSTGSARQSLTTRKGTRRLDGERGRARSWYEADPFTLTNLPALGIRARAEGCARLGGVRQNVRSRATSDRDALWTSRDAAQLAVLIASARRGGANRRPGEVERARWPRSLCNVLIPPPLPRLRRTARPVLAAIALWSVALLALILLGVFVSSAPDAYSPEYHQLEPQASAAAEPACAASASPMGAIAAASPSLPGRAQVVPASSSVLRP